MEEEVKGKREREEEVKGNRVCELKVPAHLREEILAGHYKKCNDQQKRSIRW